MELDAPTTATTPDTSLEFVGRWQNLVSITNWKKGEIIINWRQSLIDSAAGPHKYADDVWAQLVGGVTPQHVGRLRRVYERFGDVYTSYSGIYWSHFFAALEWNDAEMWLEGAVQHGWSVSKLKRQRWETLGSIPADDPEADNTTEQEIDADFGTAEDENVQPIISESVKGVSAVDGNQPEVIGQSNSDHSPPTKTTAAQGHRSAKENTDSSAAIYAEEDRNTVSFVQSFENLSELPEDLTEAFEAFKLSILRHKLSGWLDVSCEDVLASLDALKELASSPITESIPG